MDERNAIAAEALEEMDLGLLMPRLVPTDQRPSPRCKIQERNPETVMKQGESIRHLED